MKKIILSALVLSAFFISCSKKYEDGPLLSIQTKKKRLVGEWDYSYYQTYDNIVYYNDNYRALYINKDGTFQEKYRDDQGTLITINGTWDFIDKKEYLRLYYLDEYFLDQITYKIRELRNRTLELEDDNETIVRLMHQ